MTGSNDGDTTSLRVCMHANLDEEQLDDLARQLRIDLEEQGVAARLGSAVAERGTRGEYISVGEIVLAAVSNGAIKAIIDCLKTYLLRDRSLEFEISGKKGKTIKVSAKNLKDGDFEILLSKLAEL